jgi:glutamate-1-semialdehyde 2,1-aminomutase
MKMNKTQTLYQKAKKIIPGGSQLLSKRPEMLAPSVWPGYFSRAKGCEVWDLDDKHYYDFSTNNVGACLLGFANDKVNNAVKNVIDSGTMSSLNPPEEVELAEKLVQLHPWAEQARFTRAGGESMAVAVRIARATTGRSKVAVAGYHGWHDWYLAANLGGDDSLKGLLLPGLEPAGVPVELRGTTIAFEYSDLEAFDKLISEHGSQLAAIIMETCRHNSPPAGYLEYVKRKAHEHGILLIFDEITIGWRLTFGGAHKLFDTDPDIAVFSKSLGNGHPIGAVIGTTNAMEGANHSFISSTYWTDRVGPTAALKTLEEMEKNNVSAYVQDIGKKARKILSELAKKHELPIAEDKGFSCFVRLSFQNEKANIMRTLFTQLMLNQGFLAGGAFYPTLAHTDDLLEKYSDAVDNVFAKLKSMLTSDSLEQFLEGAEAHTGFKRLIS